MREGKRENNKSPNRSLSLSLFLREGRLFFLTSSTHTQIRAFGCTQLRASSADSPRRYLAAHPRLTIFGQVLATRKVVPTGNYRLYISAPRNTGPATVAPSYEVYFRWHLKRDVEWDKITEVWTLILHRYLSPDTLIILVFEYEYLNFRCRLCRYVLNMYKQIPSTWKSFNVPF